MGLLGGIGKALGGVAKGAGIAGIGLAGALGGANKAGVMRDPGMSESTPVQKSAQHVMGGIGRFMGKGGRAAGRGMKRGFGMGRSMGGKR